MSEYIDVDHEDYFEAPKALRDAYKKLAADHKQAVQERDTFRGRAEASALGDVLKGYAKPELVKTALLSSKVDPLDSEAVAAWVQENGDGFARAEAAPTPSTPTAQDPEEAAAHERIAAAGNLSQPADMTRWESAQAEIPANATAEQVRQILLSKGL
jgi:hypothetical protein